MNVLVTGAAGFIAKNFIKMYQHKLSMFYIDKLSDVSDFDFWDSLPDDSKLSIDIKDLRAEVLDWWKIDAVINFAAESHVDRSIDGPLNFTMSNVVSTHSLLETCRKYGKLRKFIQIGTDEVYGTLSNDDEYPFTEQSNIRPNSPYSASKAAQDLMARAYFETYKMPIIITRCSNNYGIGQNEEKLIPKVINCVVNGDDIPVYGNGLNVRDWIHVEDHCRGIFLALSWGVAGEVYNFGGNNEVSNIDLIHYICDSFYLLTGTSRLDSIKFVEDRKGHDFRYAINDWKARHHLGFEPSSVHKLYETIDQLIEDSYNKSLSS